MYFVCSNEVFRARTQLAIVDYNHHLQRQPVLTHEGPAYHRQWKCRTKELDVTQRKEKKNYSYVPDLRLLFICTVCVHVCLYNVHVYIHVYIHVHVLCVCVHTCTCTMYMYCIPVHVLCIFVHIKFQSAYTKL